MTKKFKLFHSGGVVIEMQPNGQWKMPTVIEVRYKRIYFSCSKNITQLLLAFQKWRILPGAGFLSSTRSLNCLKSAKMAHSVPGV